MIFALLLVILIIPVGVDLGYCEGEIRGYFRIASFTKKIYPKQSKKERQKKSAEKKNKAVPDVSKDEVLDAVEVVVRSIKKLSFRLYKLKIHFVSAFEDPYRTAMVYGYANAAVQAFALPQLKQSDIQLAVDFERDTCYLDGYISVTIRIYYILKFVCCVVIGAIPVLYRRHKRLKPKNNSTAMKGKVA